MLISVRRFVEADAAEVSALITKTLRITNSKDYSPEYIEKDVAQFAPEKVVERASWTHFYVFCDGERIVGCGAIGPYWGSETESSLFNIFVLPEYQGKGVGRKIIETLEADEYASGQSGSRFRHPSPPAISTTRWATISRTALTP